MPVYKDLRVKTGYTKKPHHEFCNFLLALYRNLLNNPHFPKPTVDLALFKAKIDEAVRAESRYIENLRPTGRVRGLGRDNDNWENEEGDDDFFSESRSRRSNRHASDDDAKRWAHPDLATKSANITRNAQTLSVNGEGRRERRPPE